MRKTLFVIGDSISLDYGPHLEAALPQGIAYTRKEGQEEAYVNLDIPRGANGGDSGMVKDYLTYIKAADIFHCDLMLSNCGLHDIKTDPETGARQVSPADYRKNLEAIVELAEELSEKLVWVRTTPVDDAMHVQRKADFGRVHADVQQYNQIADFIMTSHHVPVIPLDEFTQGLTKEMEIYRDGVHFSKPAQERQGVFLAGEVLKLLAG